MKTLHIFMIAFIFISTLILTFYDLFIISTTLKELLLPNLEYNPIIDIIFGTIGAFLFLSIFTFAPHAFGVYHVMMRYENLKKYILPFTALFTLFSNSMYLIKTMISNWAVHSYYYRREQEWVYEVDNYFYLFKFHLLLIFFFVFTSKKKVKTNYHTLSVITITAGLPLHLYIMGSSHLFTIITLAKVRDWFLYFGVGVPVAYLLLLSGKKLFIKGKKA
ncbi:hypothetical protein [Mangrovibacillus cuniculi]|uniref:Uncharacterized protein n=1 Tax=Mangrovibacillus cuniculi TaxID=2593652 RepID=A0A7S8HG47_9BACI|nr:hypothetical protein [Mangrovibacillus cuniculi]QPC47614.1 hypothetical protein G8O30_11945 [Mangrovibacillus cuniculi]